MGTLLEVKNLHTYFYIQEGIVRAVNGVSYRINEGETVALVGESGCGKSVSALSILRLVPNPPGRIMDGQIMFDGQDLLDLSEEEMRKIRGNKISMIFQEPMSSLNPVLSIGSQISESLTLHRGMDEAAASEETVRLLKLVGIAEGERRLGDYPHQFSGGMRQRVMIAMALSCNPKLIIADEPTTAVDVTIQAQLLEVMKELTQKFGTSLLLITHNLGIVARHANWVNVMYAGLIVEQGSAVDVFRDPRHPYTMGLMGSVPRLDQSIKEKLFFLPGLPPDLLGQMQGCFLKPRCQYAEERCGKENPELEEVLPGHLVRCWVKPRRS